MIREWFCGDCRGCNQGRPCLRALCRCGCWQPTGLETARGRQAPVGFPRLFCRGHQIRLRDYHRRWRVAGSLDVAEARRLGQSMSLSRAAEFLGCHISTLQRLARREQIPFLAARHYNTIRRRLGQ